MYKISQHKSLILICLIIFYIVSFIMEGACNTKVQASSSFMGDGQTKVVMVSADYLDIQDIAEDPYLSKLFNQSASAFISGRQIGKATASKAKLSIGSGKRLTLGSNMVEAMNYPDLLEDYYKLKLTGASGNVIYPDIKALKHSNRNSEYYSFIGYLGDRLNVLGKTACIIGNSDTKVYNRNNVLIVMDSNGVVDRGDVENTVMYDEGFPGGIRTDYNRLEELYQSNLMVSDVILVDTGDLARLEYYRKELTSEEYKELKKQAVVKISQFLRKIMEEKQENITFILFSAYPSSDNIKVGYRLTPILVYGANEGGLLYSKSTRREGIITNLDIADYIIEKLDTDSNSQLKAIQHENPLRNMLILKRKLLNTSVMRLPVLTWYAVFEIICAVFGLLYMLNMRFMKSKLLKDFVKTTLLVNISAPVVLLYLGAVNIGSTVWYLVALLVGSYAISYALNRLFRDIISRFAAASLIVNGSLIIDLLRNSVLIKNSVFGYDPIIGARFYGIGNEFAVVYIGSSILFAGCVLEKFKHQAEEKPITTKILLLLFFGVQLYMIGMPTMGANFGDTIAAVCGYYFFFNALLGKKIKIKQLFFLGVAVAAVISLVIFVDLFNASETSHVGKFIEDIQQNGVQVLLSTFARKIEMNLKLIKYTIWTKVLLCIILIITIMFFKPVQLLHSIFRKYKYLFSAWLGISAASIVGLIVNDSGIVTAATAMIFTGYTILYMCLEEMEAGQSGG